MKSVHTHIHTSYHTDWDFSLESKQATSYMFMLEEGFIQVVNGLAQPKLSKKMSNGQRVVGQVIHCRTEQKGLTIGQGWEFIDVRENSHRLAKYVKSDSPSMISAGRWHSQIVKQSIARSVHCFPYPSVTSSIDVKRAIVETVIEYARLNVRGNRSRQV